MQIDKKEYPDSIPVPEVASHERQISQRHLIALPTRMALMRWTRGGDVPHVPMPGREVSKRAVWYRSLQHDLQAWLEAGGFHRPEPLTPAPSDNAIQTAIAIEGEPDAASK